MNTPISAGAEDGAPVAQQVGDLRQHRVDRVDHRLQSAARPSPSGSRRSRTRRPARGSGRCRRSCRCWSKVKRACAWMRVQADAGDEEAQQPHQPALQRVRRRSGCPTSSRRPVPSQKNSKAPNFSAVSASSGVNIARHTTPNSEPATEPVVAMPIARPAWPWRASMLPSRQARRVGRGAGDVEQDRGAAAAVDRADIDADQHQDGVGRRHLDRQRGEQRDAQRRRQAGQQADDDADQRGAQRVGDLQRAGERPAPWRGGQTVHAHLGGVATACRMARSGQANQEHRLEEPRDHGRWRRTATTSVCDAGRARRAALRASFGQLKSGGEDEDEDRASTTNGRPWPSMTPAKATHSSSASQRAARRPGPDGAVAPFALRAAARARLHCQRQRRAAIISAPTTPGISPGADQGLMLQVARAGPCARTRPGWPAERRPDGGASDRRARQRSQRAPAAQARRRHRSALDAQDSGETLAMPASCSR